MSETNNSFFTIDRSTDGIYFTTIATAVGHGTTSQANIYSIIDENPFSGTVYYRLSQTDYNGVTEILSIIGQTNCMLSGLVLVSPNPFDRTTTLHFFQ